MAAVSLGEVSRWSANPAAHIQHGLIALEIENPGEIDRGLSSARMKFVYRCEIIRLETINVLARSVEGSKDHGAEIGSPVVFGNSLGARH
jgi:hypothetical protein